ncbi:MAG: arginase [Alphaproteobacteria bacterium]|jgi:arginase
MIQFIGAASGWGAQKAATEQGVSVFEKSTVMDHLKNNNIPVKWAGTVHAAQSFKMGLTPSVLERADWVLDHVERLSDRVSHVVRHGHFPVVIGGDHACAMGTWSGVTSALEAEEQFGLIWIDAHMDAHTPETSPSKAYHGMPLAHLLGAEHEDFYNIGSAKRKINPKNLCLIGIRSFEDDEQKLLETLGVRIFYMHEVNARGFEAVFNDALKVVKTGTKGYGLSIDLDGFDPTEAPATGSLEKGGLMALDVLPVLANISSDKQFKALEIAEFNPTLNGQEKTLALMQNLLVSCLQNKGKVK